MRKEFDDKAEAEKGYPVKDVAKAEPVFTRDDFETALNKATRKIESRKK